MRIRRRAGHSRSCRCLHALALSGCGSDLADVTGVVTLDGQPLRGGNGHCAGDRRVSTGRAGTAAVGLLDESGHSTPFVRLAGWALSRAAMSSRSRRLNWFDQRPIESNGRRLDDESRIRSTRTPTPAASNSPSAQARNEYNLALSSQSVRAQKTCSDVTSPTLSSRHDRRHSGYNGYEQHWAGFFHAC